MGPNPDYVVLISADAEWRVVKKHFPEREINSTPYGEWLTRYFTSYPALERPIVLMHGGWGKVSAAGSAQYAIDRWHPRLIINLGTCGGFMGEINRGEIILVEKTIIYDIYEQMGDPEDHICHYITQIDTSWITEPLPLKVTRTLLVSGDRDLFSNDVPSLKRKYGAMAGDWESGSIAWVSSRNNTPCLILRGVTDLVGEGGGEAYEGQIRYYYQNTELIMKELLEALPQWLLKYQEHYSK